jgi:hypothetical protein
LHSCKTAHLSNCAQGALTSCEPRKHMKGHPVSTDRRRSRQDGPVAYSTRRPPELHTAGPKSISSSAGARGRSALPVDWRQPSSTATAGLEVPSTNPNHSLQLYLRLCFRAGSAASQPPAPSICPSLHMQQLVNSYDIGFLIRLCNFNIV